MAYHSRYTGVEVDALLDKIAEDNVGDIDSALSTESENPVMNKVVTAELSALQTQLDSHDILIEDLQDNKVDKGDYAPSLTAGFADNLVSGDVVVDSEFNARQSGGGAISDGVARMKVLKGNSVVWNQRIQNPSFKDGMSKWGVYGGTTLSIDIDGSLLVTATAQNNRSFYQAAYKTPINHTLLCLVDFKPNALGNGIFHFYTYGLTANYRFSSLSRQLAWCIIKPTIETNLVFYPILNGEVGDTVNIYSVRVVDLTLMFDAGNEPTTIEEFYARIPMGVDLNAYNEGEVIHSNVDAVKSVGRNIWDEEWEVGTISSGTPTSSTSAIRSKNYNRCLPNTTYYIAHQSSIYVFFYDGQKRYIGYREGKNSSFTSPANAAFFMLNDRQSSTYNHDICINISDPDFNGQYEPYKEDIREIPSAIKEAFPEGMMSAGTAHDLVYNDLNKEVGVCEQRVGVRDYQEGDAENANVITDGVTTYYALDIPLITEHTEPFNLDYQVTNGGQEEAVSSKTTTPLRAEIAYGFNASAKIKENANEIASLKATIAELQAAIASMVSTTTEEVE